MKFKNQKLFFPMNIQFFAEGGDGAGADGGNGGTDGTGEGSTQQSSFDDFLKEGKNQSEFDRRIAKALETAKGKWQSDYETKLEEAKTEAKKLAKMNAEEKAKYEQDKRLADLDKREQEITTRELKAEALVTLGEKGLPKELADILSYKDADSCKTSIAAVEKAFQSAVEKAVNDKLRGTGAPKGNQSTHTNSSYADLVKNADSMTAEQIAAAWSTKR